MVNKPIAARVTPRLSAYLYIMHVDQGVSVLKLSRLHPQYSLATIHRHATKKIGSEQKRQCIKTGRPKKINPREQRETLLGSCIYAVNRREILHLQDFNTIAI